jgi:SAM-dependent methyltransferase
MATVQAAAAATTALEAYEPLAAYYDALTQSYAHDAWVDALEDVLHANDLGGPRVLDAACGTGKSTLPWLKRGYEVAACDLSPGMVERARQRLGLGPDRVFVADMRDLPEGEPYDVVSCLDDSVNYLLSQADLDRALASMAGALRVGGALLFDCNSMSLYRERFISSWETCANGYRFVWRGEADREIQPGECFTAFLDVRHAAEYSLHSVTSTVHRQRHHPASSVRRALAAGGLQLRTVLGQSPGARLSDPPDEERHPKILYLAQRVA